MAEEPVVVRYLDFKCSCGVIIKKLDRIALTDRHEQLIFLKCHECGVESCFYAKLTELYRACPPHPEAERNPIESLASVPGQIRFTTKDRKLLERAGIRVDSDE